MRRARRRPALRGRRKISRRSSNKTFKKGMKTHKLNIARRPTRGGTRL